MVCSRCGKPLAAGATFCDTCNAPGIAPVKSPSGWGAPPPNPALAVAAGEAQAYAGFWLRFLAYVIDSFVVGVASSIAGGVLGGVVGGALGATGSAPEAIGAVGTLLGLVAGAVTGWLYFSLMESSAKQATLGKMALGLAVTDGEGRPIGFGRATGRYFAKIVSAIPLLIGFLVAGFTARKQGLHDLIAGTLVVRRRKGGAAVVVVAAVAGVMALLVIVGMLAAVAIPNFLRYQLRAKSSEAVVALPAVHAGQLAQLQRTGQFVALDLPAGGTPGAAKMRWSREDLAAAEALGWIVEGATYFSYRVDVGATADGRQAFSACAEADIDGDGTYAAVVLWQPVVDEAGEVAALPPAPPCAHDPALERSPVFEVGDPVGTPVKVSPDGVF